MKPMNLNRMNRSVASITFVSTLILGAVFPFATNADWTGNVSGQQVLDGDDKGSRIRFEMSNDDRPFAQTVYADYVRLFGSGNGFALGYEPKYWINDKLYTFGSGRVQTYGPVTVDMVYIIGAGLGVDIINTDSQELSVVLGVNQATTKYDSDLEVDDYSNTSTYGTVSGEQQVSEYFKLGLALTYATGSSSSLGAATASVKMRIPGGSVVYNYSIQNEDPDVGETIESSRSSLSFEYDF